MTFDVKRLSPGKTQQAAMLSVIHQLEADGRHPEHGEVTPVVFGGFVFGAMFGRPMTTMDVLYDLNGRKTRGVLSWKHRQDDSNEFAARMKTDASHVGVPQGLTFIGIYDVVVASQLYKVRLYTCSEKMTDEKLMSRCDLTAYQITFMDGNKVTCSTSYREHGERAEIGLNPLVNLSVTARKAVAARAEALAHHMQSFKVTEALLPARKRPRAKPAAVETHAVK